MNNPSKLTINFISTIPTHKWNEVWEHCFNSFKHLDYPIKLWNEEDIDKELLEDNKDFFKDYLSKLPPIYKIDYVRYLILEKYGGAYFDLDIEIITDFLPWLNPTRMYFSEGTRGTLIENAIMIAPPECNFNLWNRIKMFAQRKVMENFEACKNTYNTLHYVGPYMLTEIVLKNFMKNRDYDILGFEQFGNPFSSISFAKHYRTSLWNQNPQ
jgi:mannosyltransferase OCH1-like enzyme